MANHLNLQHTLLEFDLQGNLNIFNHGRSVRLLLPEVLQFSDWLGKNKEQQSSQLQTAHHVFRLKHGTLIIDDLIQILPAEVRRIRGWVPLWLGGRGES